MSPRRASESGVGRVVVATDAPSVFEAVQHAWLRGGDDARRPRIRLRPHLRGAAAARSRTRKVDIVVNVQGDLPTIEPEIIRAALDPLEDAAVDIATLGVEIVRDEREDQPERRQGRRLAALRAAGCARSISPAPPRRRARGRSTTMSASMPIAAPRSSASSSLAAVAARTAREAGAAAGAGGRHAHRRRDRPLGAARRRHAGRSRTRPRTCFPNR